MPAALRSRAFRLRSTAAPLAALIRPAAFPTARPNAPLLFSDPVRALFFAFRRASATERRAPAVSDRRAARDGDAARAESRSALTCPTRPPDFPPPAPAPADPRLPGVLRVGVVLFFGRLAPPELSAEPALSRPDLPRP